MPSPCAASPSGRPERTRVLPARSTAALLFTILPVPTRFPPVPTVTVPARSRQCQLAGLGFRQCLLGAGSVPAGASSVQARSLQLDQLSLTPQRSISIDSPELRWHSTMLPFQGPRHNLNPYVCLVQLL